MSTRRERTRQRLFDAAVELIAERGYTGTTVEEIADRAGVAKGTVYYNFDSKSALFAALLEQGIERLTRSLREAAAGRRSLDALDAVVGAELEFVRDHEAFARLLLAETWRSGGDRQEHARRFRERATQVIAGPLRDAVRSGDLRQDLDVGTVAAAVFGMVLTVALDQRMCVPPAPRQPDPPGPRPGTARTPTGPAAGNGPADPGPGMTGPWPSTPHPTTAARSGSSGPRSGSTEPRPGHTTEPLPAGAEWPDGVAGRDPGESRSRSSRSDTTESWMDTAGVTSIGSTPAVRATLIDLLHGHLT